MFKIKAIAATALMPLALFAQETITLRDGSQFTGRMTSATPTSISFRDSRGVIRRFDVGQIDSLRFNQPVQGAYNSPPVYNSNPAPAYQGNGDFGNRGYNNQATSNRRNYMTLGAGTEISVRTNESINAQDSGDGRYYSAQVSRDVADNNGNVVIPRGSDAQLVVRRLSNNTLALDLQSVMVNGQRFNVDTNDVTATGNSQGLGENRRTAEYVGGGAVLGTLLGAIAGGGKGAAIGALAGGAAGAGTQVLTRGGQVRVPAESELSFRLDSAMTLRY